LDRYFDETLDLERAPVLDPFSLYTVIDNKRTHKLPIDTWITDDNGNQWLGYRIITRFDNCSVYPYQDQNDREYEIIKDSAYKVYDAPYLLDESDQDTMTGHHEQTCTGLNSDRIDWESYFFVAYANSQQTGWTTYTGQDSKTRYKAGILGYADLLVPNSGPNQEDKCSYRSSHEESFTGYQLEPGGAVEDRDRFTKRDTTWKFITPVGEMTDWEMEYSEFDANLTLDGPGKSVPGGLAMMTDGKNTRIDATYHPNGGDTAGHRVARVTEVSSTEMGMLQVYAINRVKRVCTWINGVGPEYTYEPVVHVWAGSSNIDISTEDCSDPTEQSKNSELSTKLEEMFIASNVGYPSTPSTSFYVNDYSDPQPSGLLDLINNHRSSIGVQSVRHLPTVMSMVARQHCTDIESGAEVCGHGGLAERVAKIKSCYGTYITLGEVVGCEYATDELFFQGALDSPAHRAIIENPDFTTVGIGSSGETRTLIFKYVDEQYI
jgi:uncharacterized protein YkwD